VKLRSICKSKIHRATVTEGSGHIIINGAGAHHFRVGDLVIIAAFYLTDEPVVPQMILVDGKNRFVQHLP
jgi:aspartate 1-decarboxylase